MKCGASTQPDEAAVFAYLFVHERPQGQKKTAILFHRNYLS